MAWFFFLICDHRYGVSTGVLDYEHRASFFASVYPRHRPLRGGLARSFASCFIRRGQRSLVFFLQAASIQRAICSHLRIPLFSSLAVAFRVFFHASIRIPRHFTRAAISFLLFFLFALVPDPEVQRYTDMAWG